MGNVSKPLVALLVGTVAFFALWIVALKPAGPGSSQSQGVGAYQSAVQKAHQAAAISSAANAAHGADPTSTTAASAQPTSPSAAAQAASPASASAKPSTQASPRPVSPSARQRLSQVERALHANKVVAMLFFNPAGADDQAVTQELSTVPAAGGKVVKLAVPLREVSQYSVVTHQVPVSASPTLVLIDPDQQAMTIVGFADRFEIAQRVADALAVK